MARAKKTVEASTSSRWFRVSGDKFDWSPRRGYTVAYKYGHIGFGTRACIARGLELGVIELIEPPEGAKVGKDGRVTLGD
ncbi:hypothetical protein KUG47_12130 [Falsochrobactrum sp. TDYN1]|uniref:Uncharacterized protein n=1 Tax=Falsochrobactrum tianjinense TaxID=2706015 RepID=A0A949PP47_9HYPH|nr:hypothetical protein [Falsochrobactrum sp. TDYN1]MBV2144242.1 hypothetical protein [Falsochrobactrum sp. TDYN1]